MAFIRVYQPSDLPAIRKIFQNTAFHGESHSHFFDNGDWLADAMVDGYVNFEPAATFVALDGENVIGYLTGTKDTQTYYRRWTTHMLPGLVQNFFRKGVWKSGRTWKFFYNSLCSGIRGETRIQASVGREFPAHFHINLDKNFRSQGSGHQLAEAFFGYLRKNGVGSVHVRTASKEKRQKFFESLGFKAIQISPLSLWKYLEPAPVFLITYGLSINKEG